MIMLYKLIVPSTLFLAVFLRFFNLNSLPPSLNWDEVSLGYNAYSILKTGKDEWGQFMPLSFRAYGEYKLPAYIYLDVPFIALFGLNEWGVRIPSAILGIITCIFIYLILKELSQGSSMAVVGFFIAATAPWLIILSRIALEANLALTFTTAAMYFFLKEKPNSILASLLLGLSVFAYNSGRVVSPLLLILSAVILWKKFKSNIPQTLISSTIFMIFFSMAIPLAFLQDSSARYKLTAILDQGAINQINELRGKNLYPPALNNIIFNRVTYFSSHALKNYISHFNPNFIFINGGSNYQFSVPGSPLMFLVLFPFLIYGIWAAFKSNDKRWQLVILWLLLTPIPAAITRDSPHALRSLMIAIPVILLTALGIDKIVSLNLKYKLLLTTGVSILVAIFLVTFLQNYGVNYPKDYSWSWQYGYKQAVDFVDQNGEEYSKVYITKKYGEPHEFLLFYKQVNPQEYINDKNLVRFPQSDWWWVDRFDKYFFLNDWEVKDKALCDTDVEKCLLVTSPGNYPKEVKLLQTINFLNGTPAFDIVDFNI